MGYGGDYQGVEEHQGCGNNKQGAFHGFFLLVFEN
jgi:hypothetical protein